MTDVRFVPLFSGSSGNATYISCGDTRILVDAGVSGARIKAELAKAGADAAALTGILITHDHADHISGAGVLSRKFDLPIFATEGTWRVMEQKIGAVALKNVRIIEPGQDFYLGAANVLPFPIPHDAAQPVGFAIGVGGARLAIATDMGYMTKTTFAAIAGADVVLLESNYDEDMLKAGPYPYDLKKRILSRKGHLSNDDAAQTCIKLVESGVKQILLGQLSKENNFPELAFQTSAQMLKQRGVVLGRDAQLGVARRDGLTDVFQIQSGFGSGMTGGI